MMLLRLKPEQKKVQFNPEVLNTKFTNTQLGSKCKIHILCVMHEPPPNELFFR